MKKIIKIIFIIMIYVLMFWGLFKGCENLINKIIKNNCTCKQTVKVVAPVEKLSNDIKTNIEKKPEVKKLENNTKKEEKSTNKTTNKKVKTNINTNKTVKTSANKTIKKTTKASTKNTNNVKKNTSKALYQKYAHDKVINKYGWTEADYNALVKLWNRESQWNPNSHNKTSGAHGIPQALPASKMASEGSDYYTNGYTQIDWGLKYIKQRYGTPLAAWSHSQKKGWY